MSSPALDVPAAPTPTPSQQRAIEAEPGPLLVLAGPGAGKTFCLIERIRFLVEHHGFAPERICAFTFTNKAAGEITHRLETHLGAGAARITRGTLHAFCAELLRTHGAHVGLAPGFGIADEEYQLGVLRRIEGPRRWHRHTLNRFSAYRFRNERLEHDDLTLFDRYERRLTERHVLDFDTLILRAADLLGDTAAAAEIRARFDVVLVDEFQDLNPVQYRIVRALAREHRHVFAVGDDEQSIYSWAGADPRVFREFANDFGLTPASHISLEENRRCPRGVFALARTLVCANTPVIAHRVAPRADRESAFAVRALGFDTDAAEAAWLVDDVRSDRAAHGHRWGDVAVLYRKHEMGERLETEFINAAIPCRLPQGRALADDPAAAYVIAAARVIAAPDDAIVRDAFFHTVLDKHLYDEALAKAGERRTELRDELRQMARRLGRAHEDARKIRRALADCRNFDAVGRQHHSVATLVQELLSRRVGRFRSILDEHHDDISDPASLGDVMALAGRLRDARARRRPVWIPPMGGAEIPIIGMLAEIGVRAVRGEARLPTNRLSADDVPSVGIALGVFKAAQLVEMADSEASFANFTAVDLETTDKDVRVAEIVEIAATRVRDGRIVDTFTSLVKPRLAMKPGAAAVHGITDAELAGAPAFADVWPRFRAFCGTDVIVAHNGYEFDFKILRRAARELGAVFDLCTYDTLPLARDLVPASRKLPDLARHFAIETGQSHRALDDTRALAHVLLALDAVNLARGRKTALLDLLGHLGVALALAPDQLLGAEALAFRGFTRPFSLGRYSDCLEFYEREQGDDTSVPSVDEVIERLGGAKLMARIRAEKTADERYPSAMRRLRRIIAELPEGDLTTQLPIFLERAVLSRWDGDEPDRDRVNLLTLHSTKGLEFSRVYIVGAEDAQLPGGSPTKGPTTDEIEEARRLLYVGMTRTIDRLVLTRAAARAGKSTGGHRFLDEMGLALETP